MVKEFLLGDNPFLGISHLAQVKAREEKKEATLQNKVNVIKAAIEGGVTGFTFSTHQSNLKLLRALYLRHKDILEFLNYYLLVPYAYGYVRKSSSMGIVNLARYILKSLVKENSFRFLSSIALMDVEDLVSLFIYSEIEPYIKLLPKPKVKAVLVHEILTELMVAYDMAELYEELENSIRKDLDIGFGIETRNIVVTKIWLDKYGFKPKYIMTPMNALGYQMAPSKEEAEEAISKLSSVSKIIAINILASGALPLDQAIEYLLPWKYRIYAVAVGTSKHRRAYKNFIKLRKTLET